MTIDTTRKGMEELDITDGTNRQRRMTDITQPLDYEAEEPAQGDTENRRRTDYLKNISSENCSVWTGENLKL